MKTRYIYFFAALSFLLAIKSTAQFTIASSDFTSCEATFNDTNPVGQYGNNEDETITICADGDEIVNLYFIGFDLGTGDVMTIYDGSDTNAPVIGTYDGTDIVNQNITSTINGCLTLHWVSDDTGVGDFGAIVSCGPPCEHPIVHSTIVGDMGNPLLLCVGESFTLDATSTEFLNGTTIAGHVWDFGDESTDANSWPQVTHSFNQAGAYVISLTVTDNTGCQNLNTLDQIVWVSTTPTFTTSASPPSICIGSESRVVGRVTPTHYSNVPEVDFGDGVYIPDNQGCFSDTIVVSGYPAGSTIVNPLEEIESLYASLEHTYLTDITIAFLCPNGSVLSVYSQQGQCGDIDLGIPIAADDGLPGEGIMYTWTPETTYPTLAEGCSDTDYTFDDPSDSGLNLIEGDYASEDDWSNFVGCPYNGPWVIQICDIVGADDGWIFEWGVEFPLEGNMNQMAFTPSFGIDCDSTYWTGNYIDIADSNCDSIWVSPGVEGIQTYTYHATDNFGCTYTTTQNVVVVGMPVTAAQDDVYYCNENLQLQGTVTNPQPGLQYAYSWSPAEFLSNPTQATTTLVSPIDEPTTFYVTAYWVGDPACTATDSTTVLLPVLPLADEPTSITPCLENLPYDLLAPPQEQTELSYSWVYSNADTSYTFSTDGYIVFNQAGQFVVTITEPHCQMSVEQEIAVYLESCEILIPNIMTPDGDGKNDTFMVQAISKYNGSTLQLFNRWGNLVYEDMDYGGEWSGEGFPDGTYYYIVGVNKRTGMEYYSGDLSIIRK